MSAELKLDQDSVESIISKHIESTFGMEVQSFTFTAGRGGRGISVSLELDPLKGTQVTTNIRAPYEPEDNSKKLSTPKMPKENTPEQNTLKALDTLAGEEPLFSSSPKQVEIKL